jgi:hypothetical protein
MLGAVLWQVASDGARPIRCVLERLADGQYRLHVLKGQGKKTAMFEQDYPDRRSAIEASITIYRGFKDKGFHDTQTSV